MRCAVRSALIVLALIAATSSRPAAQATLIKDEVMKDWIAMKDTFVKISNEMPEDKFGYRSTPPQRNYGEHILHVASVNVALLKFIGGKAVPPAINMKATSKAEIMKAMTDSFNY